MKHIVCFHLFNDYSGSPMILRQVLGEWLQAGRRIDLFTSRGGVLDDLANREGVRVRYYRYRYSDNPAVTTLRYGWVQIYTFMMAFRYLFRRDVVFYINTLLPVGPALAGKIMGKKVIYHCHENASAKGRLYISLSWAMQRLANGIVCVSGYQRSFLKRQKNIIVVPNALPRTFCDAFGGITVREWPEKKTVLMLSSLKRYKGVLEFIELARRLPQYGFRLVVNDTGDRIETFLRDHRVEVPSNLEVFDRQDDVIPFYREASLVVNLSDKTQIVETFGLTALEAMTAGLPVIVPTVGGIAEMVEDGVNGYKIDVQELDKMTERIDQVLSDPRLYGTLSLGAKERSGQYDIKVSAPRILSRLDEKKTI